MLAELAGIDRAAAYDVLAASAVGAPYVGYKRAAFLDPDGTPVAFSARPRREGPAADHRRSPPSLGLAVPQADANLALIARGIGRRPRRPRLLDRRGGAARAGTTGGRRRAGRANEEEAPARPSETQRGRPAARDQQPVVRHRCRRIQEAPMADRILIKNGDRPDPGPDPSASCRRPTSSSRATRSPPSGRTCPRTARGSSTPRATSSSRASSTPTATPGRRRSGPAPRTSR